MKTLNEHYEHYGKEIYIYIYSFCRNHEIAEDIVQDTFYKAYGSISVTQPDHLKAWLFKVAYHLFIDYVRKEKRVQLLDESRISKIFWEPDFESKVFEQEEIGELFLQIDGLPFNQKQALLLHSIHKLSYGEIAQVLEITESSVKSLIFRARATLRKVKMEV